MRTRQAFPLLALSLVLLLTAFAQEGPFRPYRQTLPDGTVSWYEGWIQTRAVVPLATGVPKAQAQTDARRVALMKAQAAALRIAMKVPMDAERRLEEFEALKVRVQGVVRGGKVLEERLEGTRYLLSLEVPISGVNGIAAEAYPVVVPELAAPPKPPQAGAAAPPAGPKPPPLASSPPPPGPKSLSTFASVRVEADEVGAKPALYPKILDPQGQPVYSAATVRPEVARRQTIARYVGRPAEGPSRTLVPGDWAPSGLPLALVDPRRFLLAQQVPPVPPAPMPEAQAPIPYPFAEEVLVVKAVGARGKLKADLVVTEQDAQRLRQNRALLEEAQVTVVVRTDVGGVESRRPFAPRNESLELGRR